MDHGPEPRSFPSPWWDGMYEYDHYLPNFWPSMAMAQRTDLGSLATATANTCDLLLSSPELLDLEPWYNIDMPPGSTGTAVSSLATWNSSASESASPTGTPASIASQSQDEVDKVVKARAPKGDDEAVSAKRLLRKVQNRVAQQAHRERKKKLVEELWTEVHSLRAQNGMLQKQLRSKIEMLQHIYERVQLDETAYPVPNQELVTLR